MDVLWFFYGFNLTLLKNSDFEHLFVCVLALIIRVCVYVCMFVKCIWFFFFFFI